MPRASLSLPCPKNASPAMSSSLRRSAPTARCRAGPRRARSRAGPILATPRRRRPPGELRRVPLQGESPDSAVRRSSGSPVCRSADAGCASSPLNPTDPQARTRSANAGCPSPAQLPVPARRRSSGAGCPLSSVTHWADGSWQPLTGAERPSPPVTHTRAVFPQHPAAHKGLIPPLCALRCCVIQSLVCGSDRDRAHGTVDALAAALRTSRTMRGSAPGTADAPGRLSEPGSTCDGWDGYAQTMVGVWR